MSLVPNLSVNIMYRLGHFALKVQLSLWTECQEVTVLALCPRFLCIALQRYFLLSNLKQPGWAIPSALQSVGETGLRPARVLTRTASSYERGPSPPRDSAPTHRIVHGSWPQGMMGSCKSEDTGQHLSRGIRCNGKCTGSANGWMCSDLDLLY